MWKLAPMKMTVRFVQHRLIAGKRPELEFEGIEIIAGEGGDQHGAELVEIFGDFELLFGAAHGKIVNHDLALVDSALRHSAQFTKLQVIEMLDTQPYAGADHGQDESECTAGWPEQEQTEHGKHGRNGVKNDHHLAMRKPHLQQLVMDMFAVGREDGASADETADDR